MSKNNYKKAIELYKYKNKHVATNTLHPFHKRRFISCIKNMTETLTITSHDLDYDFGNMFTGYNT